MKDSWKKIFPEKEWKEIQKKIIPKDVFPEKEHIFSCFNYFELLDTKVILCNLSPYQSKFANGLAFGIPEQYDKPSLQILRDCIAKDYNHPMFEEDGFDYTLESWARQGVLLYNVALTVPKNGGATDHVELWSKFTERIFKELNQLNGLIFVFFGNDAKKYEGLIDERHYKLLCTHPAYTARNLHIKDFKDDLRKVGIFKWIDEKTIFINKDKIKWYG
jgi:uracil-DNA glycosylase